MLRSRELRERVPAPDHEVRVLSGFQRTDTVVDGEDPGRVDGDGRERLLLGESGAQELPGLPVHPTGDLRIVRVQRHRHARLHEDPGVVLRGVVSLHLERAPVTPHRRRYSGLGELWSQLVRFNRVLQDLDPEAELLGQADQGEVSVGPITVRRDQQFLVQDVEDGLHAEVAAGWQTLSGLLPALPLALVVTRGHEVIADDGLGPHPCVRIAALEATTLRILAQGELHQSGGVLELEFFGKPTPAHLHDGVLTTDWVGGAVLDHGRGEATRQLPVHRDIVVRDHVPHLDLGNDGRAGLVHAAHAGVDVRVDHSGRDVLPCPVDLHRASRRIEARPDFDDLPVADQKVGILQAALLSHRPDRRVADDYGAGLVGQGTHPVLHHGPDEGQVDLRHFGGHGANTVALEGFRARASERRASAVGEGRPAVEVVTADRTSE